MNSPINWHLKILKIRKLESSKKNFLEHWNRKSLQTAKMKN